MRDRYDELYRAYRWQVPARFNIAEACCGRHARDRYRFGLYWEDESGATAAWTYWDLQQQANRLSNALAALGVKRGDRVGIVLPQRPETVIAHVACYQMGAVAMPLSILFGPEALEYRTQPTSGTNDIYTIDFVDVNTGWAFINFSAVAGGSIFKTTNGGISWTQQGSNISYSIYSADMVDANIGYLSVNSSGQPIFKTTNGGTNWFSVTKPLTGNIKSVKAIDANTVLYWCKLWNSKDG